MTITFTITFHGPFHVSSGTAQDGIDATISADNPLPGTSLKGLLRAEARDRLGVPEGLVDEIFGRSSHDAQDSPRRSRPSPWWFGDAELTSPQTDPYARVHVDHRGRAQEGMLAFGIQVWASSGTFQVEQRHGLSDEDRARHATVLRAAARSVSSLGGSRRRGSGWVTVEDTRAWSDEDTASLLSIVRGSR